MRVQANKAAIKAIIMNRIGDFGIFIGILLVFLMCNSIEFSVVFNLIPFFKDKTILIFYYSYNLLSVIAIFLFIGVVGKSAQIGLHT